MDQKKNKITSPFTPPEGYFDSFESRLKERMANPSGHQTNLKTSYRKKLSWEMVSAAAAAICLLVTAWYIFKPAKPLPSIVRSKSNTVQPVIEKEPAPMDSSAVSVYEHELVTEIVNNAEGLQSQFPEPEQMPAADARLVSQLEDAGLIVDESGDGLFDEIEL